MEGANRNCSSAFSRCKLNLAAAAGAFACSSRYFEIAMSLLIIECLASSHVHSSLRESIRRIVTIALLAFVLIKNVLVPECSTAPGQPWVRVVVDRYILDYGRIRFEIRALPIFTDRHTVGTKYPESKPLSSLKIDNLAHDLVV